MSRLQLFDSHCHLDDSAFQEDRDIILEEIRENLLGVVNPGSDKDSSQIALDMAHKYPFVRAAVRWHPEEIARCTEADMALVETWCQDPKVVAVGEIGLDYYNDQDAPHELQKQFFVQQLHIARRTGLPVIIHDRDAHGDMLDIIKNQAQGVIGVMHCYSGSLETAKEFLKLGWYFGFGGSTTFKNSKKAREVLAALPEERILFETDSPYMAPVPFRGKRNKPTFTELVVKNAAQLRNTTGEELMKTSTKNLKKLFFRIN